MKISPTFFNKPTAAVHIQNVYTATERKLVNICLHQGIQDGFQSEMYAVDVWETLKLLGCEHSKNSDWLKNDLFEALLQKVLRWNVLKKDKTLQEWSCTFLSGLVYEPEEGKLAFQFNPNVVKQFQQHSLYSKLMLQIQAPIKSGHTLTMYEYLNDELQRKKARVRVIVLSITDLRALLDIGRNKYLQFKYLNSQAIKPAFIEVNKHTDIDAFFEPIKEGRSIIALRITAKRKQNFQLPIDLSYPSDDSEAVFLQPQNDSTSDVVELLVSHGITETKAKLLAQSNPIKKIVNNLNYSLKQKGIKNFPSYLVKAIEHNYSPEDQVSEELYQAQLREAWERYKVKQVESRFGALSEDDQTQLRQEFVESLENDHNNRLTRDKFNNEGGWQSRWVQISFQKKLATTLLEAPEETDFKAFIEWWPRQELKELLPQNRNH